MKTAGMSYKAEEFLFSITTSTPPPRHVTEETSMRCGSVPPGFTQVANDIYEIPLPTGVRPPGVAIAAAMIGETARIEGTFLLVLRSRCDGPASTDALVVPSHPRDDLGSLNDGQKMPVTRLVGWGNQERGENLVPQT